METKSIRDIIYIAPQKIELIVFKEKVDDLKAKLINSSFACHAPVCPVDLPAEDLKTLLLRLEKQIERLPERLVMVRKYLQSRLVEATLVKEMREAVPSTTNRV